MNTPIEVKARLNEIGLNSKAYFALVGPDSTGCDYVHRKFMEGSFVLISIDGGNGAVHEPTPSITSLLDFGETETLSDEL